MITCSYDPNILIISNTQKHTVHTKYSGYVTTDCTSRLIPFWKSTNGNLTRHQNCKHANYTNCVTFHTLHVVQQCVRLYVIVCIKFFNGFVVCVRFWKGV